MDAVYEQRVREFGVVCEVCGGKFLALPAHLYWTHGMSVVDYKSAYGKDVSLWCAKLRTELSTRRRGHDNPFFGRHHTVEAVEEIRKGVSASCLAYFAEHKDVVLQRVRATHVGRKRSPTTRLRQSLSKGRAMSGGFQPEKNSWQGKSSYFFSAKNQRSLFCASRMERSALEVMEALATVVSYRRVDFPIPYQCVDGSLHHYYADFVAECVDGIVWLVEVKPSYCLSDSVVQLKAHAARVWCAQCRRTVEYHIWSECDLVPVSSKVACPC